jgi:uncharacterized membrane protein
MRLYAITMFVHILGVIAMFGGFAMQQRAGGRLRQASSPTDARPWSELLMMTRPMVPSGAVMLLLTGGYLAYRMGGSQPPAWVMVAAITVLWIGLAALVIVNPRLAAIARSLNSGDTPPAADGARSIASAALWGGLAASNGSALGTLWLMTAKPGLVEALIAVSLPTIVGAIVGGRLGRRVQVSRTGLTSLAV